MIKPAEIISEDDDITIIKAIVFARTDLAIGVYGIANSQTWVPLSDIDIIDETKTFEASTIEFSISNWLVGKKDLV